MNSRTSTAIITTLMTRRVRCCMSCAGLSWWGKKGGNMKLSDYLKNIDNLDEKMEKAVIIAGYERMLGEHYRLPQEQFADLMELPLPKLRRVIHEMKRAID